MATETTGRSSLLGIGTVHDDESSDGPVIWALSA